jgi:MraZ protein
VFLGEYGLKFSSPGRVILPKKIREELSDSREIILSRGMDGCIWGFDLKGFEVEANKQIEISSTDLRARDLRRYLFSGSERVELDKQGRFVIPTKLLEYAGIKDELVIIGSGDHFEIWNGGSWTTHLERIEKEYGRIS